MNTEDLLKKGLKEIGIPYSEGQIHAFMTYLSELKKWNKTYNLTALKTDNDIIIKHFLDSLLYLKALPEGRIKLADAGTGAGFPGIPIKIVRPETDVALIEPTRKKTAFLRHIIRQLQLSDINVLEKRLEDLGKEHERQYNIIVSRATFHVKEFLKTACPYVRENGRLVLNKGPKVFDELKELEGHLHLRDSVREIHRLQLPFSDAERNLVVLECKSAADICNCK